MPCKEEEDESQPTHVSVPRETGETKGVKSRDQTCLGFALQGGGRRSQRAGGAAVVIELTFGEGQK